MEPVTSSVMIGSIVTYLATKLSKEKSITSFISEFTGATVNWIKPIFLKEDGSEKEAVQQLKEKPDSPARQNAVKSLLETAVEDQPEGKDQLKNLFEKIAQTSEGAKIINTIINSTNVNTGDVNTGGGDFIQGSR